ncbi:MAG: hypothetical protein H0W69_01750 [Gemmatimonadaceae bacterium]|nr:hypothetical protein [Gemmatimonadaceae bacterium]
MTAAVGVQPVRQPWRRLVFAAAAMVLVPLVPHVRAFLPIEQTMLLVIPAVASCALAGWRNGERLAFATIWIVVSVWMLAQSAGPAGSSYDFMARGWALLLAACFGLSAVLATGVSFFPRALASLGAATIIGFGLAAGGVGGAARVANVARVEFTRRNAESIADLQRGSGSREWQEMTAKSPSLAEMPGVSENQLRSIPPYSSNLVAALLGLESLAALALAWSVYHRFATHPVGPALGRLREFRFNDQLVWGLAVGATIFLLPPFIEGRSAGLNLLVFFGSLYVLRGFGILAWMTKGRTLMVALVFATLLAWPLVGILALGLGLGDTWLDWRKRAQGI